MKDKFGKWTRKTKMKWYCSQSVNTLFICVCILAVCVYPHITQKHAFKMKTKKRNNEAWAEGFWHYDLNMSHDWSLNDGNCAKSKAYLIRLYMNMGVQRLYVCIRIFILLIGLDEEPNSLRLALMLISGCFNEPGKSKVAWNVRCECWTKSWPNDWIQFLLNTLRYPFEFFM